MKRQYYIEAPFHPISGVSYFVPLAQYKDILRFAPPHDRAFESIQFSSEEECLKFVRENDFFPKDNCQWFLGAASANTSDFELSWIYKAEGNEVWPIYKITTNLD